ncbi:hypothetical protein ACQCN2_00965 [Brevibacillus ginsengisoli]|uniref:hypothetical protein n=1 Tax=Brevibacillus ginsengisoli TaxID=363854 RepID=UPI003CF4D9F7
MFGKAAVINVSAPHYNLGAHKLYDWLSEQGWQVEMLDGDPGVFVYGYDLVCLSVIFTWHAPIAKEIALRVKANSEVWCGGPGIFSLSNWWKNETGLDSFKGLDPRLDKQRGKYRMTFASRGCPVGCYFCIVPQLEGLKFTLDWDFTPAPILCDNNLSALPVDFQEHIIKRYQETGTKLADANSGFEPRFFNEETYLRWKEILRGPWRFAFDEVKEEQAVFDMMQILNGVASSKKRVYVLIGNEPMEACYERLLKVVEWGGEPYCQPVLQLNYLGGPIKTHHDWTEQRLRDFARYANRFLWKYMSLSEYNNRKNEPPPFREFEWAKRKPIRKLISAI